MNARRIAWLAMVPVLIGVFVVGLGDSGGSRTSQERAQNIGESIACPTCAGQSVADSDATAARNIRVFIDERIAEGELSDDEIRAQVNRRFDDSSLLTPERSGVAGLVWALPVVVLIAAVAGLGYAFYRWRGASGEIRASQADKALVDRALEDLRAR